MSIKVRATQLGFYKGRRRRPGAEFDVDSKEQVSKKWMQVIASPAKAKVEPKAEGEPKVEPKVKVSDLV